MREKALVIFDLETTGLNPKAHEIIEIGALKVDQAELKVFEGFALKMQPYHIQTADPKALEVNGYSPEDWRNAFAQDVGIAEFGKWVKDCLMLAQNITFDWGFLVETWERYYFGTPFPGDYHRLDLASMSWFALPNSESISISKIAERLGVHPEPKIHRAYEGAALNLRVLRKLREVTFDIH
jgi:DNA polymerase III alpha subunit (gram-positive type)